MCACTKQRGRRETFLVIASALRSTAISGYTTGFLCVLFGSSAWTGPGGEQWNLSIYQRPCADAGPASILSVAPFVTMLRYTANYSSHARREEEHIQDSRLSPSILLRDGLRDFDRISRRR